MFDTLSDRFGNLFRNLSGRGRITEENVRDAMREVRTALLEADVHIDESAEAVGLMRSGLRRATSAKTR